MFNLLIDSLYDTGKLAFKLLHEIITKNNYYNFDQYFKRCDVCSIDNEKNKYYPRKINSFKNVEGMNFVYEIPIGMNKDDIENLKEDLIVFTNRDIKIITNKKYFTIIVIENYIHEMSIKYQDFKKDGLSIPIGENLTNQIKIDLECSPHTYIVGTTGSGKSVCIKSILTYICENFSEKEIELYLCDMKRVELNLFKNVEQVKKFVYKIDDVLDTIEYLLEVTNNRYVMMMKNNVTNIFEYNKLVGVKKFKFQFLFIEEVTLLLQDKSKTAMKLLTEIMAISRACGLYVFISTQRPSNDIISPSVKAVISNRIVFQVEDEKNSIICLDDIGAEKLKGHGHGILKIGGNNQEFKSYYISDIEVKNRIEKFIKKEEVKVKKKTIGFVENNKKISNKDDLTVEYIIEDLKNDIDLSFLDRL